MNDRTQILVDHVSYSYDGGETIVLDDVSLDIKAGEFVAVLGHNGCGKSTLAKLLNGLYVPTKGSVHVCGMDTADDDLVLPIRQRAGMIFQNPDNQIVASIVKEDVAFGLENLGIPTEEMLPRIESALNSVGMIQFADSAPHLLSGGQKQRVAIAGIIAMQPNIIIADESTSMLDPTGRKDVLDTVKMLNRQKGITVVWITHFMEEAAQADRIVVMNEGKIVANGTPGDVFHDVEKMRAIHLDVPHMADLSHRLRKAGMPLPESILTVDEMAKEVAALLCPSK
ncbi:MAG: energy-coupling factor transporter ATPase [Clostridia bacterium]|nr:energy-coupling factor transporter ATPase [Clostridia bacterium]